MISIDNGDYGYVGFFCEIDSDLFEEFLNDLFEKEIVLEIKDYLKKHQVLNVFVLKNLWSTTKGQGHGSKAMEEVVRASQGSPILLVSDNLERQNEGFILQNWYESKGFAILPFKSLSGPLMMRL